MGWHTLLRPGETCWTISEARRLAFLIDSEAYFGAFKRAALGARHSILIVGWDVNSQLQLEFPERAMPDVPNRLGPFLTHLLERRAGLGIQVLHWDSPLLFKLDREWLPRLRLDWLRHPRAQHVLDNQHPLGAAHHQKIVVIDDALAFVGGMDFAIERLDSRAHIPGDPRRRLPDGTDPQPIHDIQMAVDGPAARAIAALARDRWRVATGQSLPDAPPDLDPWPGDLQPDLQDIDVAVARTRPAWKGLDEIREIEALLPAAIAAARHWIYIENQFLTAPVIAEALRARLDASDGPEIVILLPSEPTGWLAQTTVGICQRRILAQLRAADRGGRLRVYMPMLGPAGDAPLKVHAKGMIIDGRFVTLGSANLNNRSMGLDTECNLALAADPGSRAEAVLTALRDDLLAEHLDLSPAAVTDAIAREGGMIAGIEALRGPGRSLTPFPETPPAELEAALADTGLLDPAEPAVPERLADDFVEAPVGRQQLRRGLLSLLATVALFGALVAVWPLEGLAGLEQPAPGMAVLVLVGFVLGGLVLPLMPLVIVTGLAFGPWTGFGLALSGAMASAALGYGLGVVLGRRRLRRLTRGRLEHLTQRLGRRGVLSVAVARLLPVAPFPLINLSAGTARIRLPDYLAGSALGMLPGLAAFTLFSGVLRGALMDPAPLRLVAFALVAGTMTGFALWLWRRFVVRLRAHDG
ncbi:MAG: VTT domain-containing protein [Alkalilacustris sp.]